MQIIFDNPFTSKKPDNLLLPRPTKIRRSMEQAAGKHSYHVVYKLNQ